jgi:hypothetical protein
MLEYNLLASQTGNTDSLAACRLHGNTLQLIQMAYFAVYHRHKIIIINNITNYKSQITEFIYQYMKNWKEHGDRMNSGRTPKIILKYQPKGKRNFGRPLKRWKDSVL